MAIFREIPWCPPEHLLNLHSPAEDTPDHHAVFLDSGGPIGDDRNRWSFFCPTPKAVLNLPFSANTGNKSRLWQVLRGFWQEHRPPSFHLPPNAPPFTGGLAGMLSHEAGLACEAITSRHKTGTPLLIVMACSDLYLIDRQEERLYWASETGNPPPVLKKQFITDDLTGSFDIRPEMTRHEWKDAVRLVRDYIAEGDIFQANLTMRWEITARDQDITTPCNLYRLYDRLRRHNPAPFGAFLTSPGFSLLSASVERFLSLTPEGLIETRPIKGTAPLSANPDLLAQDSKERAENIMITDLMRHDIGRVCAPGSVHVPRLCTVEEFAHLYHLVSSIQGQLDKDHDAFDLLAATIPPGSVTGAPKHRALELIDQIETSARGAYCGTVFRLGWDGSMDSSVIIRSLSATDHRLFLGAGGGITWPSDPEREYEEMVLKAAPLLDLFQTGLAE